VYIGQTDKEGTMSDLVQQKIVKSSNPKWIGKIAFVDKKGVSWSKGIFKGSTKYSRDQVSRTKEISNTNTSTKTVGGTVGGAVVGGVLTGGIGAIVGGLAGGNKSGFDIKIAHEFNDGEWIVVQYKSPKSSGIIAGGMKAQLESVAKYYDNDNPFE
jgi:hypothetical protein